MQYGHILVTDGACSDDGAFHPLESWDADAVMKLFRERLLARLIERRIPPSTSSVATGERGVAAVLKILKRELEMALSGRRSLAEIDSSALW